MTRLVVIACVAWLAGVPGADAHPVPLTVGLFAPSAPFPSTAARVELANQLGAWLGKALGAPGAGRVYARAADFAAAVKRGEVTLALVDPTYLASITGSYTVIAVSLDTEAKGDRAWHLVARAGANLAEVRGKRVLVPSLGGREADFVWNVLLGGDVGRDFFANIEAAPDTASALAALGLGKADAVVVPVTGELPPGTAELVRWPASRALPNPLLVAYKMSPDQCNALREAARAFPGDATITGFRDALPDAVASVARQLGPQVKRGPFLIPAARLVVGDLVEDRTFVIERTPATAFAIAPTTR